MNEYAVGESASTSLQPFFFSSSIPTNNIDQKYRRMIIFLLLSCIKQRMFTLYVGFALSVCRPIHT